jgi:glyoxylase-like metal-dependent hydrolase (beta-lactamase superfamily II)
MFQRRQFLKTAGLAMIGAVVGVPADAPAQDAPPRVKLGKSQAGFWRLKVGGTEVIALSDGTLPLPTEVLTGSPEHVATLMRASWAKSPVDLSVNAFLIVGDDRLMLVDAGTGTLLGPTLDKLEASLGAAGYKPEQITDILVTHLHADHIGGLTADGKRVFPNAVAHVNRVEADYWLNEANKQAAAAYHQHTFDMAKAKFGPYLEAGKASLFDGETALFPGIRSLPAPGHTPGHSFYVLESGGEKLVFWGDIVHIGEVQFPDPNVSIRFDSDPKAAAARRKRVLAQAASEGTLIAGAHIAFPGAGRLAKAGSGYRWIPMPYVNDAPSAKG